MPARRVYACTTVQGAIDEPGGIRQRRPISMTTVYSSSSRPSATAAPLLAPLPLHALLMLMLLLLCGTTTRVGLDGVQAAAVGFPLGGDGGEELWQAVRDAADNKGFTEMLSLLQAGANVNWQNEDMVGPGPPVGSIAKLGSPCLTGPLTCLLALAENVHPAHV